MIRKFQPMLAIKADFDKIIYPCLVSPKLDGIRCIIKDGIPLTRKLKPIPNLHIYNILSGLTEYDGEIMVADKNFNDVQSSVMSKNGEPDFEYHIFDAFTHPNSPFSERFENIKLPTSQKYNKICKIVQCYSVNNEEELLTYLELFISWGYEGLMIRSSSSPYKFGRSTVNEGFLLKVKKFFDDEAILIGMTAKMNNINPKEKDKIGNSKRSSHKSGMIPTNTVGSFLASWNDLDIRVGFGQGITDIHKQDFWDNKELYLGKKLTFKYQELSPDGIPRFGKFIGFRQDLD